MTNLIHFSKGKYDRTPELQKTRCGSWIGRAQTSDVEGQHPDVDDLYNWHFYFLACRSALIGWNKDWFVQYQDNMTVWDSGPWFH